MHGLIFSYSDVTRNLGPYRIAHILRNEGWDIEVIDYVDRWSREEIVSLLKSRVTNNTKFIGVGKLFYTESAIPQWLLGYVKTTYPSIVTILGTQSAHIIDNPLVDYAINGWGERAIVELLKYLFSNGSRPVFTIQSFGKKTKVIDANTSYPAYPLSSLMAKYENRDFISPMETLSVEFSRGCRFKCKFCNFPVLGVKGDYTRTSDDFREQIQDAFDRFGVTQYYSADETFNDYTEKIIKYADVVESLVFQPLFCGFIRADVMIAKKEQKEHLARMNFIGHQYGIESFNYESAKAIGKGMHPDRVKEGLLETKHYFKSNGQKKYRGHIGLIIGLPHETEDTILDTYRWLYDNWTSESVALHILQMSKGEAIKSSELSLDFKKYNYSEMQLLTDRQKSILSNFTKIIGPYLGEPSEMLIWKNEHLDFFKAIELKSRFEERRFGLCNWNLFSHAVIDFNRRRVGHPAFTVDLIIDEYKKRKLNL